MNKQRKMYKIAFLACSLSIFMLTGCASNMKIPPLVAHRGESDIAPENTVPAYELAWKNNRCWAIETDVYLTKDNVLICCHDKTTLRTTGVDLPIEKKGFAELRTLNAGYMKGPMWHGVKLPSLQEVFMTVPKHGHIFVEIKSAGPNFAKAYEEARLAGGVSNEQVTIISFSAKELKNVRKMLPHVRTLLLIEAMPDKNGKLSFPTADEILKQAKELKVTGVDLEKDYVNAEFVKKFHDAGLEIHVWTVDKLDEALKMSSYGVDSITTNRSRELYEELNAL